MIQKIEIEEFLALAKQYPVLDVRSPGEFGHAHIPGARNFPLFSDDERKVVGTAYKQQNREQAIKIGLGYFGGKMVKMVEEAETIAVDKTVLVHCWRGGMRSAGVAWLLDLYGFKIYTLVGGYKAFRNYVLQTFNAPFSIKLVGGYTGSGKTNVLKEMAVQGRAVVDLEEIAAHKGSAFGGLDMKKQPTQEMFENILAIQLHAATAIGNTIWMEDESQRIGNCNLPHRLWNNMRSSPLVFVNIPFEERLENILKEYGVHTKEQLVNAIIRIQKRLGGLDAKNAIGYLLEDNFKESFRILLKYYDRYYDKSLQSREGFEKLITRLQCEGQHAKNIAKLLEDK